MDNFRFDAEKHRYYFGDLEIPGISAVIKILAGDQYAGIPEDILERARKYGDAVHKLIELIELKTLDPASIGPALKSAKEKWERFKEEEGFESLDVERPLGSRIWCFGGRPDVWGRNRKKENLVVEIKTTVAISTTVAVQTAAQDKLIEENYGFKADRRLVLQILPDTDYRKPEEFESEMDWRYFLAALTGYNFRKKAGLLK